MDDYNKLTYDMLIYLKEQNDLNAEVTDSILRAYFKDRFNKPQDFDAKMIRLDIEKFMHINFQSRKVSFGVYAMIRLAEYQKQIEYETTEFEKAKIDVEKEITNTISDINRTLEYKSKLTHHKILIVLYNRLQAIKNRTTHLSLPIYMPVDEISILAKETTELITESLWSLEKRRFVDSVAGYSISREGEIAYQSKLLLQEYRVAKFQYKLNKSVLKTNKSVTKNSNKMLVITAFTVAILVIQTCNQYQLEKEIKIVLPSPQRSDVPSPYFYPHRWY